MRAHRDRAAQATLPSQPYLVTDRHLRRVGKDWLVSFEASFYSVPGTAIRAEQRVELRADIDTVAIHALTAEGTGRLLATHPLARVCGSWVIDESHWDGLPDGHARATVVDLTHHHRSTPTPDHEPDTLAALLSHRRAADIHVAHRPLADYAIAAGLNRRADQHPDRNASVPRPPNSGYPSSPRTSPN